MSKEFHVQELCLKENVSCLRACVSKGNVSEGFHVSSGVVCIKLCCHEPLVCVCELHVSKLQCPHFLGHTPLHILEAPVHNRMPSCCGYALVCQGPRPACGMTSTCACDHHDLHPPMGPALHTANVGPQLGTQGTCVAGGRAVGTEP